MRGRFIHTTRAAGMAIYLETETPEEAFALDRFLKLSNKGAEVSTAEWFVAMPSIDIPAPEPSRVVICAGADVIERGDGGTEE